MERQDKSLTQPLPFGKGEGKVPRPSGVSGGGRRFLNIKGKFFPTGKRYATEIHLDGTYHSRMIADASWAEQGAIVFIESKRGMVIATEVYGSAVTVQTSKGGDYVRLVRTVQLVSADIAMPGVDMFIQTYKVPKTLDTVTMFFEGETFLGMTDLDCSYLVEKDPITITDLTPGHMGDKRELQVQQNTALIALHWDKRYEKFSQLKRVVSLIPHPDLLPFQKGEGEKKGRVYADN